jgi:hypothetical protein
MSVKNDLAVQEFPAVRRHHAMSLLGAKNCFVKVQRSKAVADYQMWSKLILSIH